MGKSGIVLLMSFALLGSSLAGTLGSFENAVAKPESHSDHQKRTRHNDYDNANGAGCVDGDDDGGLFTGLAYGTYCGLKWLFYDWWANPDQDNDTQSADWDNSSAVGPDVLKHKIGTPGMPYMRFDYRWQYLDSDTDANDYLLEAGYKYAALYGRYTDYQGAANEKLNTQQYYAMLRIGGSAEFYHSGSFQIGAGLGWYTIKGNQVQEGPALTIPIMLYPTDWYGFEFRPAWVAIGEKTVSDYDVSASIGQRFTHLRLGYRWLWVQGDGHWLNGPYAGVSVSF